MRFLYIAFGNREEIFKQAAASIDSLIRTNYALLRQMPIHVASDNPSFFDHLRFRAPVHVDYFPPEFIAAKLAELKYHYGPILKLHIFRSQPEPFLFIDSDTLIERSLQDLVAKIGPKDSVMYLDEYGFHDKFPEWTGWEASVIRKAGLNPDNYRMYNSGVVGFDTQNMHLIDRAIVLAKKMLSTNEFLWPSEQLGLNMAFVDAGQRIHFSYPYIDHYFPDKVVSKENPDPYHNRRVRDILRRLLSGPTNLGANDYSQLEHSLQYEYDKLPVSVIVTAGRSIALLQNTLRTLMLQQYPHELMELVVVADEASDVEQILHNQELPFAVKILYQRNLSTNQNSARNNAIISASHDRIITLDRNVVIQPHFVQDYMRFLSQREDVLLTSPRRHLPAEQTIDLRDMADESFLQAVSKYSRYGAWFGSPLLGADDRVYDKTDDLRSSVQPWEGISGNTLGFSRRMAKKHGLLDNLRSLEGSPIEFAYRMSHAGAFVIPVLTTPVLSQHRFDSSQLEEKIVDQVSQQRLAHHTFHRTPGSEDATFFYAASSPNIITVAETSAKASTNKYARALNLLLSRNYESAISAFTDFVNSNPRSNAGRTVSDAFTWIGHAYRMLGNTEQAGYAFARARETYDSSFAKRGITAIVSCIDDVPFIRESLYSIKDHVDEILLSYSPTLCRSAHLIKQLAQEIPHLKLYCVDAVPGFDMTMAELRNSLLREVRTPWVLSLQPDFVARQDGESTYTISKALELFDIAKEANDAIVFRQPNIGGDFCHQPVNNVLPSIPEVVLFRRILSNGAPAAYRMHLRKNDSVLEAVDILDFLVPAIDFHSQPNQHHHSNVLSLGSADREFHFMAHLREIKPVDRIFFGYYVNEWWASREIGERKTFEDWFRETYGNQRIAVHNLEHAFPINYSPYNLGRFGELPMLLHPRIAAPGSLIVRENGNPKVVQIYGGLDLDQVMRYGTSSLNDGRFREAANFFYMGSVVDPANPKPVVLMADALMSDTCGKHFAYAAYRKAHALSPIDPSLMPKFKGVL